MHFGRPPSIHTILNWKSAFDFNPIVVLSPKRNSHFRFCTLQICNCTRDFSQPLLFKNRLFFTTRGGTIPWGVPSGPRTHHKLQHSPPTTAHRITAESRTHTTQHIRTHTKSTLKTTSTFSRQSGTCAARPTARVPMASAAGSRARSAAAAAGRACALG